MRSPFGYIILAAITLELFGASPTLAQSDHTFPDFKSIKGTSLYFLRRVHTLAIEKQVDEMVKNGETTRTILTGFSVKGALLYGNHELTRQRELQDRFGRQVGSQYFAYKISVLSENIYEVKVTMFRYAGLNHVESYDHSTKWYEPRLFNLGRVIDTIDVLSGRWDRRFNYRNAQSIEMTWLRIKPRIPIISDGPELKNLIALTGDASFSLSQETFLNVIDAYTSETNPPTSDLGDSPLLKSEQSYMQKWKLEAGAEAQISTRRNLSANFQGSYQYQNTQGNHLQTYFPDHWSSLNQVSAQHHYQGINAKVQIRKRLNQKGEVISLGLEGEYNHPLRNTLQFSYPETIYYPGDAKDYSINPMMIPRFKVKLFVTF